jgi:EamA domain-containing membrane protein RarD
MHLMQGSFVVAVHNGQPLLHILHADGGVTAVALLLFAAAACRHVED